MKLKPSIIEAIDQMANEIEPLLEPEAVTDIVIESLTRLPRQEIIIIWVSFMMCFLCVDIFLSASKILILLLLQLVLTLRYMMSYFIMSLVMMSFYSVFI